MNRLVCTNLDASTPRSLAALPPPRTQPRRPGEPVRVLFVQGAELGFATTARNIRLYAEARDDIEAVHFSVVMPLWLRVMCAESPVKWLKRTGFDFHGARLIWAWSLIMRRFIFGPLGAHENRYDVIHFVPQQRALIAPRLRRRTRLKIVVNCDATTTGWDRDFEIRQTAPRLHVNFERQIFGVCDAVACASNWVLESVVGDYGVPRNRAFLHMPCAPRLEGAQPRSPDAHLRRGPDAPLRIAFVGNDWDRKGGPRLLRWHQERWADTAPGTRRPRVELHICSAKAPQDHTARGVVWHGPTPHDKLIREILPSCDLFVMPTREDTFLIAAQEAQTMGLPVITSRLAGIPEVVLHERTGILCRRDDDAAFIQAVESFLDDPDRLTRFAAAATEHGNRGLSADLWHNHLLDQLIAIADGRPVATRPAALETGAAPAPSAPAAATIRP